MCTKLCKQQDILFDGKKIVLRNPRMSDLDTLMAFINLLVDEDAPILGSIKKVTREEEKSWLKGRIKGIENGQIHGLCVFDAKECIANVTIEKGRLRHAHMGVLGISVKKKYRGRGLGLLLMQKIIEIAKKDPTIKVLTLNVYGFNKAAINLYRRVGFKTIARLPKRSLYKKRYVDEYVMDFPLRK